MTPFRARGVRYPLSKPSRETALESSLSLVSFDGCAASVSSTTSQFYPSEPPNHAFETGSAAGVYEAPSRSF